MRVATEVVAPVADPECGASLDLEIDAPRSFFIGILDQRGSLRSQPTIP